MLCKSSASPRSSILGETSARETSASAEVVKTVRLKVLSDEELVVVMEEDGSANSKG